MRIGVDLGGTKIEAIALDDDGAELARHRIPTPRDDYDGTIHAIRDLIDQVRQQAGQQIGQDEVDFTVGIGMPGSHHPRTGLVPDANSTWLDGKPFHQDLEAALGYPGRPAHGAHCFCPSGAGGGAGGEIAHRGAA